MLVTNLIHHVIERSRGNDFSILHREGINPMVVGDPGPDLACVNGYWLWHYCSLLGILELVDDRACGGGAAFKGAVHADAAPAVGVIGTGEEEAGIKVIEKPKALCELALA